MHDNTISASGAAPTGEAVTSLVALLGKPLPAILFDGIVNPKKLKQGSLPEESRICLQRNGDASFANYDAGNRGKHLDRSLAHYDCALAPVAAVTLPQAAPAGATGGQ